LRNITECKNYVLDGILRLDNLRSVPRSHGFLCWSINSLRPSGSCRMGLMPAALADVAAAGYHRSGRHHRLGSFPGGKGLYFSTSKEWSRVSSSRTLHARYPISLSICLPIPIKIGMCAYCQESNSVPVLSFRAMQCSSSCFVVLSRTKLSSFLRDGCWTVYRLHSI
jgi:hypothetical protein